MTVMTFADLPEIDVFSADYLAHPYDELRKARDQHWVARSPRGFEVLTYEMCEALLTDERFHDGAGKLMEFLGEDAITSMAGPGRTLTTTEGAEHAELRRAVTPWFTPKRVRDLRGRTGALVDQLLDSVAGAGRCDFMADVAQRIPGRVFCWMVGAPEGDGDQIGVWSGTLLQAFKADPDDVPAILAASQELSTYVDGLIRARKDDPGDDVTSMLLAAVGRGQIDDDDVKSLLYEMLTASTDNTAHSAGLVVELLVTHRDFWQQLQQDRSGVQGAIEECLRFGPRVTATPSYVPSDVEVNGVLFPAGALGWLNFASAHRDPAAFPDPDRFDINRTSANGQLNFGLGRHFCLGAALARMELEVVLEAVLDHWLEPTIDGGDDIIGDSVHGSVASLPISFTTRT